MTNHPNRSRQVVTYQWTAGGNSQATVSLCRKHDIAENRIGYDRVSHGLHAGRCDICTADETK